MTFREYLMEKFQARPTNYGTDEDCSDGSIVFAPKFLYTMFKSDGIFYCVSIERRTGDVGFGSSKTWSPNANDYTVTRKDTPNALKVFNKVIFVVGELTDHGSFPFLRFSGADPALGKVYERMAKNTSFLREVEKMGYAFVGEHDGELIFQHK